MAEETIKLKGWVWVRGNQVERLGLGVIKLKD